MAQITQIIPTYNMRDTVCRTIDSCLNQTVAAPLIVIDDGSTDGTDELVVKKYRWNLLFVRTGNRGMASAMNHALHYVDTPYFVFTGADDVVDKDNIKNWLSCDLSDVNYAHIGIKPVSPEKILPNIKKAIKDMNNIRHCHQFYTDDGRHIVDGINCLCLRTDMVRKEKFDENLRHKEGGELLIRLALLGYEFRFFDFIGGSRDKFGKSTDKGNNDKAIGYIKNKLRDFNIS